MSKLSNIYKKTRLFRVIISIGMIALASVPLFSNTIKLLLFIGAAVISGIDVINQGLKDIDREGILNAPLIISACSLILFIIGYHAEAAVVFLIFHFGIFITDSLTSFSKNSALNLVNREDLDSLDLLYTSFDEPGADNLLMENTIRHTVNPVFHISILLSALYAIFMPLLNNLSVQAAIHRALSMIVISTPMSMTASFRSIGSVAQGSAAAAGLLFKKACSLECISDSSMVILDEDLKERPSGGKIIYCHSSRMNQDTFLNFIYHVVYQSEQPFAVSLKECINREYNPDLVYGFIDIPGFGIQAGIGNNRIIFGNDALVTRLGINISEEDNPVMRGLYYYLCIDNTCVGSIILSGDSEQDCQEIVQSFNDIGLKCLFSNDESANKITKKSKTSIFFPKNREKCKSDINICINNMPGEEDGTILPDYIQNISMIPFLSRRVNEVSFRNALFVFIIKVLIISFSILGFVHPWLALLLDLAAACFSILNSNRVRGRKII